MGATAKSVAILDGLWHPLRSAVLGRRTWNAAGVIYRERSSDPLRRALARRGRGYKEYDVAFPDGHDMLIRCEPARLYHDLVGQSVLARHVACESLIRPGIRVLDARTGTGASGAWLGQLVGTAGAVVALDDDEESIEFANHRYDSPNVSFEQGGLELLSGEIEGSFELVLALGLLKASDNPEDVVRELWRVVSAGGVLVVGFPTIATPTDPGRWIAAPSEGRRLILDVCAPPNATIRDESPEHARSDAPPPRYCSVLIQKPHPKMRNAQGRDDSPPNESGPPPLT